MNENGRETILIMANNDAGLYKFRKELIKELLTKGCVVYISLPNGSLIPSLEEMGCHFLDTPIDRRGINPVTDAKLLLHYLKLAKEIKPDLVITYTIKPNIYGGLVCRLLRIPYAMNITGLGTAFEKGGWIRQLVVTLYKMGCRSAKKVFFENKENLLLFGRMGIIRRDQAVLLHGAGVNLEEFPFTPYPAQDEEVHFLFIGRVMKEKGVDEFFEAARMIREKNSNVVFDIVGPYEDDYETIVEDLQREGIIRYHGYQEDVKPFIAKAHCFVLPSYHEGMANTLLESAAMGRPLITSDIPGCREAVADGINGFLCEAKNSKALYDRLEMFIRLSDEDKAGMGQKSRLRMKRYFDRTQVVEKTVKALL